MFIQNTTVNFRWNLTKTAIAYLEDYFDLSITKPDGTVEYLDAMGTATSYQAPTETVDGFVTKDILLEDTGVYTIVLSTGTAIDYQILSTQLVIVVDTDLTKETKIILP